MKSSATLAPRDATICDEEWQLRLDLAACYQLVAHFGWDDLIYTHISLRIPGPQHHFLINPYGMMFDEITASSLVKVDLDGNKVDDSPWPVNGAGFIIHSAVHMGRESAGCVMHIHTADSVAVSGMEEGLLPLNQAAILAGARLSYHDYEGPAFRPDERERLLANLGGNLTMILRNHGVLAVGRSVAEAFFAMYMLQAACSIQVRTLAGGRPLHPVSEEAFRYTQEAGRQHGNADHAEELVWPALLRLLDRKEIDYRR